MREWTRACQSGLREDGSGGLKMATRGERANPKADIRRSKEVRKPKREAGAPASQGGVLARKIPPNGGVRAWERPSEEKAAPSAPGKTPHHWFVCVAPFRLERLLQELQCLGPRRAGFRVIEHSVPFPISCIQVRPVSYQVGDDIRILSPPPTDHISGVHPFQLSGRLTSAPDSTR